MQLGKTSFLRLNIERILYEEILKMRPELRPPISIANGIYKFLEIERYERIKKRKIDKKVLEELGRQAESLYCYNILKMILMSELGHENKKYTCLTKSYQV